MGIYFEAREKGNDMTPDELYLHMGYGQFKNLRDFLAPYFGVQYFHKNFTDILNPDFDDSREANDFDNYRYIPEFGDLWIRDVRDDADQIAGRLFDKQDIGDKLSRVEVRHIATLLEDIDMFDNAKFQAFKDLILYARNHDYYVFWD